jgi:uncharacterized membrane protein
LPVLVVIFGMLTASWQNEVRRSVGETAFQGPHILTIVVVALITAAILITCARLIARAINLSSKYVERWLPARFSLVIGSSAVVVLLFLLYNGVIVKTFVTVSNNIYSNNNAQTDAGVVRPHSSLRSGGPGSLTPWDTLGRQGRNFVAGGPHPNQLAAFNGRPALEPIRIYAGLKSASNANGRAALAVRELKRAGAFDRAVLCVMTPTGTGWIEPQSADSLEYMWNGNTALVATQYSYLPSWISFLVDQQNAAEEGRALFNAVYREWKQLPPEKRPKLIAYGLSLGSYGGQAAFSGAEDLQDRTNGALFMGSPGSSQPWSYFTKGRDHGSPERLPVYQHGQTVRFAASDQDIARSQSAWVMPRTLYIQHASDPIVWWDVALLVHKPDWLKEPRGSDVSTTMRWYPFVTFFQVSIDQFFSTSVPAGRGHNYSNTIAAAWAAIVPPPNWNVQQTRQLQTIINNYSLK